MQKPDESIEQIRTRICARRRAVSAPMASESASAACQRLMRLDEFTIARRIGIYLPVNGEIDTSTLIRNAWQEQKLVYLPVLQANGALLFAAYTPDSAMRNNRYRIPEPVVSPVNPPLSACGMDLLIVPLVAFDSHCQRIGMGAGYYDRTLADCGAAPLRVGLAYEFQKVASIPARDWDIPMDKIVTENAVYSREDGSR